MNVKSQSFLKSLLALVLAPLLLVGCTIDWTGLLSTDHTRPDPNPPVVTPAAEFRLLVIEETGNRPGLPASQQGIFTSVPLRTYLKQHAAKLPDGSNGFRFVDVDDLDNVPAEFKGIVEQRKAKALASAKANRPEPEPPPWVYATNGREGVSCPLPGSVEELMAKIKPYAEGK